MEFKFKKLIAQILSVAMILSVIPTSVFAEESKSSYSVNTIEGLIKAAQEISKDGYGKRYTINLVGDITWDLHENGGKGYPKKSDIIKFENGKTVIYGNGHTLKVKGFFDGDDTAVILAKGLDTELSLGDGNNINKDKLNIVTEQGTTSTNSSQMIVVRDNATLNMYDGVTITGNNQDNPTGPWVKVLQIAN